MKIIQFIDSLTIGGAEVVAMNLATGLNARGHESVICGIGKHGNMSEFLEQKGLRFNCMNMPSGFSLFLMSKIFQLLSKEKANIVVTHHFRQLIHSILPAKILGKKIVHIEHDSHFYEDKKTILRRLLFLLKFVDSFICVSTEIVDWFTTKEPRIAYKAYHINNGIDIERFKPDSRMRESMRAHYGIKPESFVLGTCARLEPIKNIELLIDGFAEFQRDQLDAKLIIIGDGSQRQELLQRTSHLKVGEHVIFTGVQQEVEKFLPMFDAYSLTSHDEGLPLSVLEAMATGLPLVATNVGALPRLINEQTGILLEKPTSKSLANAFHAFKKNLEQSVLQGKNGRSFVHNNYSIDTMINSYLDIFYLLDRL